MGFGARQFAEALAAALQELRRCCQAVNALNVFPVADHDTGTNLCATLASAADAAGLGGGGLGEVVSRAARGAFSGARGSSGAILAEYLYGLSEAWAGLEQADGRQVAEALRRAARSARAAVQQPVEGTVLTVADAAAREAEGASGGPEEVLRRAAESARATWLQTPSMLAVLRQAGVVDAGAAGLVALLEAMAAAAVGLPAPALSPPAPERLVVAAAASAARARYCTELVVRSSSVSARQARRSLSRLGDAVVAAERDGLLRVHVHTDSPHRVVARALRWGELQEVRASRLPEGPSPQDGCAASEDYSSGR